MTQRFTLAIKLAAASAALCFAGASHAQSAGSWSVKVGANKITPKVTSGNVSAPALPGTKTDVLPDTQPMAIFSYMLTNNFSVETAIGTPYEHDLIGDGAIKGTGKLGSARVLPAAAFVQYRFFDPSTRIRPYVGLGGTYAMFQKEKGSGQLTALLNPGGPGTTFKVKDKLAVSPQIGVSVAITDRWFVDAAVIKTYLKTTATFSTGQTQELKLDPLAVNVGIGYRF
ncbi:MAG TPA: OmpW family outer membrane protein [Burkholderiaceae bacterium]